jgi:inosose dehydratase
MDTKNVKMVLVINPTAWTNDDFPEIGNDTPYQVILDQTKGADFAVVARETIIPAISRRS